MALHSCVSSWLPHLKALPNKEELKSTNPESARTPFLIPKFFRKQENDIVLYFTYARGWTSTFPLMLTLTEPVAEY